MIRFIKKIRDTYKSLGRDVSTKTQLNEFEKRLQQITFAYTQNLEDGKSDYLKRYLEVQIKCIQSQVENIQGEVSDKILYLQTQIDELNPNRKEGESDEGVISFS